MRESKQPIIVGLDIGSTKVVAIAGRKTASGKIEIIGLGQSVSAGVSNGIVLNIEQCTKAIEQAIDKCLHSSPGLEVNEVSVGLTGEHIKCMHSRGDRIRIDFDEEISSREIELLLSDQYKMNIPEGNQVIDIIPQRYAIDKLADIATPIGMRGTKLCADFKIIMADSDAVNGIRRCINKSGLQVKGMQLQPVASAMAVADEEDMEAGVAIVDIGGGTTDVAVYHNGILKYVSVIPYGANDITEDIRNELGILRPNAEQVKHQHGTAIAANVDSSEFFTTPGLRGMPSREISRRKLATIIQSRMTDILEHVVFHLKQSNLYDRLHGGIILTGGGAQLNHVVQLTERVTGLTVRIGYAHHQLADGYNDILVRPVYATAVGLVLGGYKDYETTKIIVPEEANNYKRSQDESADPGLFAVNGKGELDAHKSKPSKSFFKGLRERFIGIFESEDVPL